MKRTALFFASTAILFSSPHAMAEQPTLNRPYISSNTNVPQMLLAQVEEQEPEAEAIEKPIRKKKQVEEQINDAQQQAVEESDAAAESQKQAVEQAKKQADQGARDAQAKAASKAEQAQRDAQAESDKAAEQQKAIQSEAKQKAADEAAAAEAAQKQASDDAEQAKRDAQAEADKAAEEQKAVGEAARAKAASEAEAAKATEEETAKEAENAKKAAQEESDKAAAAQKSEEEKARKKVERAQKDADKQSEQAVEDAKKAADKASKGTPAQDTAPEVIEQKPAIVTPNQPAGETPTAPSQEATPVTPDQNSTPADETTTAPLGETVEPGQQEASPLPENAAPVLDSDKPLKGGREEKGRGGKKDQATGKASEAQPAVEAPATTSVAPPKSDADVQQELAPVKIEPVRTEKGTRTKERRRDERPDDVQVIKQFDNRTIVEVNNNIFVESSDRPRMSRDAQDVYYEDLPRNRTRETIIRENGVQIITVRNRYGDVIQRSRVMPDGREVVLSYAPDYDREERLVWRDPGDDLPPLRLTIPVREYIMDAEEVPEEEVYEFFAQPPVERVERLYSIDEVKRSARIRDKVRRVDLDTITFPFGSAEIGEDQIARIESVANAIAQTLKKNPAETFLIEGHTDAVGSDQANLILSDKRAESVAQALTNVFDIPPENMATQGYGENYLKIKSEGPEQQNRRVAIRRITPLVAPMASNK
ncbi:OmpA family protein [Phyllobacterium sp. K27]